MRISGVVMLLPILTAPVGAFAAGPCVEQLIDQLVNVSKPGYGYSDGIDGTQFLPYGDSDSERSFMLGAVAPSRSETLRKIVAQGADAVPQLIRHLSDKRALKTVPLKGIMFLEFSDEYDFNRATAKVIPKGVNRDPPSETNSDQYALTVGDLCFVALGQIVNRHFTAARYQQTGGLIVNSPVKSAVLRKAIIAEWSGLTKQQHRSKLIDDFTKADTEEHRIGAYQRLSFYYPETVEKLVLDELAKPMFDPSAVFELCHEKLYTTNSTSERQRIFDDFIHKHGEVSRAGVLDLLFYDLDTLEADEEHRLSPPLTRFQKQPRELLIQLFNKPANIRSTDRPIASLSSDSARACLIRELTHDQSAKIGATVKKLCIAHADNDYFVAACLHCLAHRGYGSFIADQLAKIDLTAASPNYILVDEIGDAQKLNDRAVRSRLLQIVQATTNDAYFVAALPSLGKPQDALVLKLARRLLDSLPPDTQQGENTLAMIGERFPKEARAIYQDFLKGNSAARAGIMCRVLNYGSPLAKELLAPMLDDKRSLPDPYVLKRVCDRAAAAISRTSEGLKFDIDADERTRDKQIQSLKEYCKREHDKG